jgi:DNA-binding IclR family transcriptional regulator
MTAEQSAMTDWLHLVRAEYLEMPGLQLTLPQVRRLWGLEDQICHEILEQLVEMHFLRRNDRELYVLDAPSC